MSYSEAVDLKKKKKRIIKEEEGSSCLDADGDADAAGAWRVKQVQGKKLDYQEILNAWSDNQEVLKENTLGFQTWLEVKLPISIIRKGRGGNRRGRKSEVSGESVDEESPTEGKTSWFCKFFLFRSNNKFTSFDASKL